MSRKKVSTTIYITPEQADRLKLLHERTKVPIAVYIREGIDLVLKHYEHVLPGQMTLEAGLTSSETPRPAVASPPLSAPPPTLVTAPAARREVPRAAASHAGHAGHAGGTSRSGEGSG
jgi:hypothetical protein